MKRYTCILLAFLLFTHHQSFTQVADTGPSGKQNILPREGGSIRMKIDSITPISELINRLNGNWQLLETGKMYWIGYTNDMYSIAARGDEAVPALVNFYKTTDSLAGKIGAIYTLHLVGINRQVIGRFIEKFVNAKARAALLELLKHGHYAALVVSLLMRDPWPSDIPHYFDLLQNNPDEEVSWAIVNSLRRYRLPGIPIGQPIPSAVEQMKIKLNVKNENVLERDFDFNGQVKEALREFSNRFPTQIKVDTTLYDQQLIGDFGTKLRSSQNVSSFISSISIEQNSAFSYGSSFTELGCRLQYYVEQDVLHFCTISTAVKRLIDWWNELPMATKEKFRENNKIEK